MTQKQTQTAFFLAALLVFAVVAFLFIRPYLAVLAAALALATLSRSPFHRLTNFLGGRSALAAFLTTLLVLLCVMLPLGVVVVLLGREVTDFYDAFNTFLADLRRAGGAAASLPPAARWLVENVVSKFSLEQRIGEEVVSFVSGHLVNIFSNIAGFLFSTFLFFFAFYYFLKDGSVLRQNLLAISPLSEEADAKIYERLTGTINAVIRGTLIVGLVQGVLAGVGFWIFGVGAPVLLGSVVFFSSFIPAIGTGVVFIPVVGYLAFIGMFPQAIGLALWSALVVGLIDNLLRPKLIQRQLKIHPLFILISILGGLNLFGFLGFLIGPMILAAAWALGEIYHEEFRASLAGAPGNNTREI